MANLGNFNANDVEPNVAFEPIPAGKYLAVITKSDKKKTKDGTGEYLELEMDVLEGEFRGRKIWDRLCINHPNSQTVTIARGKLSAICRAVGVMQPRDSVELHNLPLVIAIKLKKRADTGELGNEVKGYESKTAASSAGSGGGKPQQAPVNSNTPPWKR